MNCDYESEIGFVLVLNDVKFIVGSYVFIMECWSVKNEVMSSLCPSLTNVCVYMAHRKYPSSMNVKIFVFLEALIS